MAAGSIRVGMLGYSFLGKAHSRGFREDSALSPPLVGLVSGSLGAE
jgi:hypothetical protein